MRQLWQHFDYGLTDLQFDECGIQQFEPYQVYQYTVYQPYIIHWIASGKGSLEVDNHCYPLTANQGFILRRGQQVKYYADGKEPWRNYWIGFSGQRLEEFLQFTQLADAHCIQFQDEGQCQAIIQDICHYSLSQTQDANTFYWQMMKVFDFLYHAHLELASLSAPRQQSNSSPAEVAAAYIYANYARPITVESIAQYIGMSRSALFRLFRQHYRQSPKQFLMETRLRQARQLLVESQDSIKTIAASVGYSDQLVFSKIFKKTFGLSPSDYRDCAGEPDYMGKG